VRVGLREGSKSCRCPEEAGLKVTDMDTAAEEADLVMILIPDEIQAKTYEEHIAKHLQSGDTLAFAHGFNIHYGYIKAPEGVNVIMVAPKGPGHIVRRQYTEGSGVPDLAASTGCHRRRMGHRPVLRWAIGGARAGLIKAHLRRGDRRGPLR
jgi:ketol-acid reductoisomerase